MLPTEGVGGTAEKVAPLIRFPALMRTVFPGAFAALCLYPFTNNWEKFALTIPHVPGDWSLVISASLTVFAMGTLVSALRTLTYKLYMGDACWPNWLFTVLLHHQQSRVRLLRKAAAEANTKGNAARERNIWRSLRMYPLDPQSDPCASSPTLLGNIIAAYETYPLTRYRMDSVFYWPRIWLQLEKEKKEEIDAIWSRADGLLSLSAVALAGGLCWIGVAIAGQFGLHIPSARVPLCSPLSAVLSGLGLLALGYVLYRFSLKFHTLNGEIFKAVFDLYRDTLRSMLKVDSEERARWEKTWLYLQYLRIPSSSAQPAPQLVTNPTSPSQSQQGDPEQL